MQKSKPILESIEFSDKQSKEEMASTLADIVAQMGQDVSDHSLSLSVKFVNDIGYEWNQTL